ncbi:hypothetical protein EOM39_07320 [Candidatus Gracilibacteria bacterium]|nr:hypothetical protein [Candidatus Gracilibacteria bacterium]
MGNGDKLKEQSYSNIKTVELNDITRTIVSGYAKSVDFIVNYLKSGEFYDSLNKAGITPNNITTFRIFLLIVGVMAFYTVNHIVGLSMITGSGILDVVDGKLARKFGKKSKEGETFDAGFDKITDIVLTVMGTIDLSKVSSILASANGGIGVAKTIQHVKSQFRKGRPTPEEQLDMTTKCILKDETTQYIDKPSSGAAINYGKYKTITQMSSQLGILWTTELAKLTELGLGKDVLDTTFVFSSAVSLVLGYFSIKGGKK